MSTSYRQLLPSTFELWYIVLGSLGLLAVGNAKLFLEHYDLIAPSAVVGHQVSDRFSNGLSVLDSFSFTPGLVTFITWGAIGLVVFSLAQAIARASGIIRFERDLGSDLYVHPQNFDREAYWRHVVADTIVSFGLLALLVVCAALYLLFIVPVSFSYTQQLLINASLKHFGALLVGIFTVFAGTLLLYALLRIVVWHHRITLQ